MHRMELLAIGTEADDAVAYEELGDDPFQLLLLDLDVPEHAIATDDEIGLADFALEPREQRLEIVHHIDALGDGEHQPLIDCAEEGEAVIGIDLLDRAYMVESANAHHQ